MAISKDLSGNEPARAEPRADQLVSVRVACPAALNTPKSNKPLVTFRHKVSVPKISAMHHSLLRPFWGHNGAVHLSPNLRQLHPRFIYARCLRPQGPPFFWVRKIC